MLARIRRWPLLLATSCLGLGGCYVGFLDTEPGPGGTDADTQSSDDDDAVVDDDGGDQPTNESSTSGSSETVDPSASEPTGPDPTTSESTDGPDATDSADESSTGTGSGVVPEGIVMDGDRVRFVGNSYTGNYGGLNNYVAAAVAAGQQGLWLQTFPQDQSWFFGQPLSGMTSALDAIESEEPYETCVFTSGSLGTMRTFATTLSSLCTNVVLYATWEGANPVVDGPSYASRIETVLSNARQLESEFPQLRVVPAALVFYDLSVEPLFDVPRLDYLNRSENIHQNGLGTIVNSYVFYAVLTGESPLDVLYDYNGAQGPAIADGETIGLADEQAPFSGGGTVVYDAEAREAVQRRVWTLVEQWYAGTTAFD